MNNSYRTTLTIKDNGDGQPKKWSLIKYTVAINVPLESGGHTVAVFQNVQSAHKRPDDPVDVTPASVGSSHPCTITQGFLESYIFEEYAMGPCATGSAAASRFFPGGFQAIPPDAGGTGGNTTGTQGGQTGSGAGDGTVGVPP